jgi:hypothetical protein
MSVYATPRVLARPSRTAIRQAAAGLLVAAFAAGVIAFVTERTAITGAAVVLGVAGTLWFAATRHTQLALALLMLYLGLLDGYLKLASSSTQLTFIRDVLLYAIVVGLLVRATVQRKRLPLPPLSAWVIAFVVLVLIQIPNPHSGTLEHSLAGVRQHLEFVPLFFLAFAFVRTTRALRTFVILLAVIAAANGIAGWVQFRETPQQFASWGPGYAQRVLGTGNFSGGGRSFGNGTATGGTRPFGLGSDAGDGGVFGVLALGGILALASLYVNRRYLLFAVVMAAAATLAIITSQSRGVVVAAVLILLAFVLLSATSRNRFTSLVGLALAVAASVLVVQAIIGSVGSSAVRYKALSPTSLVQTTNTARGKSIADIPHNLVTYPFGAGLGVAGPATSAPGGSPLAGNLDAETELSFLTLETGIPGMLVYIGFVVALLVIGVRRCRHEPDPEARVLLAALIAPLFGIFALFASSATSPAVPTGPYVWAVGGIVAYWLVTLPATRRRPATTTTANHQAVLTMRTDSALRLGSAGQRQAPPGSSPEATG